MCEFPFFFQLSVLISLFIFLVRYFGRFGDRVATGHWSLISSATRIAPSVRRWLMITALIILFRTDSILMVDLGLEVILLLLLASFRSNLNVRVQGHDQALVLLTDFAVHHLSLEQSRFMDHWLSRDCGETLVCERMSELLESLLLFLTSFELCLYFSFSKKRWIPSRDNSYSHSNLWTVFSIHQNRQHSRPSSPRRLEGVHREVVSPFLVWLRALPLSLILSTTFAFFLGVIQVSQSS